MTRADAKALVERLGGVFGTSVTKDTSILVVGGKYFSNRDEDSTKVRRAIALLQKGHNLQIMSEAEFLEGLSETSLSEDSESS